MNNQIVIQKLIENPLLVYQFSIPEPQRFELNEYEEDAFPAIIGNLLNMSISRVSPKYKMGRVLSFDISPRNAPDPIIIYSPIGNLKPYYKIWKKIMEEGLGWRKKNIKFYDDTISLFLESSYGLTNHEIMFSVIEMLKFKNDVVLNPNFQRNSNNWSYGDS